VQRNLPDEEKAATHMRQQVLIHYRTDDGKKHKLIMRAHDFEQRYSGLSDDDRLVKHGGEDMPVRG